MEKALYTYHDMLKSLGSAYQINKAVQNGSVFKAAPGVYSKSEHPNSNAVMCARYPSAVLTMDSAFYLHGLTDVIPEAIHLATPRNATRITSKNVKQYYMEPRLFTHGITEQEDDGYPVRVFSKERMLVELLRHAGSLPPDYYKELISSYRRTVHNLDMRQVEDCLDLYSRSDSLFEMLQKEVL